MKANYSIFNLRVTYDHANELMISSSFILDEQNTLFLLYSVYRPDENQVAGYKSFSFTRLSPQNNFFPSKGLCQGEFHIFRLISSTEYFRSFFDNIGVFFFLFCNSFQSWPPKGVNSPLRLAYIVG